MSSATFNRIPGSGSSNTSSGVCECCLSNTCFVPDGYKILSVYGTTYTIPATIGDGVGTPVNVTFPSDDLGVDESWVAVVTTVISRQADSGDSKHYSKLVGNATIGSIGCTTEYSTEADALAACCSASYGPGSSVLGTTQGLFNVYGPWYGDPENDGIWLGSATLKFYKIGPIS